MALFIEVPRVVRFYGDQDQFKEVRLSLLNADCIADVAQFKPKGDGVEQDLHITMADGRTLRIAMPYVDFKKLLKWV